MFYVFEGIDCSGKTLAIKKIKQILAKVYDKKNVIITSDPKGTNIGNQIWNLIVNEKDAMNRFTELFLFISARVELITTVIKPEMSNGNIVLCDRFIPSTLIYQLSDYKDLWDHVIELHKKYFLLPKIIFIFTISFFEFQNRILKRKKVDKFEKIDRIHFDQYQNNYISLQSVFNKHGVQCFIIKNSNNQNKINSFIAKVIINNINNKNYSITWKQKKT